MKKTVREMLAERIEKDLSLHVFPEDLIVNKGANKLNDWCSWAHRTGAVCSWTTMRELVTKETSLVYVDKLTREIS